LDPQTASEDTEQEAGERRAEARDQRKRIPLRFMNDGMIYEFSIFTINIHVQTGNVYLYSCQVYLTISRTQHEL
jgi:hypothetical protein